MRIFTNFILWYCSLIQVLSMPTMLFHSSIGSYLVHLVIESLFPRIRVLVLCYHHLSAGLPPSLLVPSALVKVSFLQRFILSDFTRRPSHITVAGCIISIISGSLPNWYPSWVYLVCHITSWEYLLWILITANAKPPPSGWVLLRFCTV